MSSLDLYIFTMEAVFDAPSQGSGLVVAGFDAVGSGTCGLTTGSGLALPGPAVVGTGDWQPAGTGCLPALLVGAATPGWLPAWGGAPLPLPAVTAQAFFPIGVDAVLPPLFSVAAAAGMGAILCPVPAGVGLTGAYGGALFPVWTARAGSGLDRRGAAAARLPLPAALAYACSLENPVTSGAASNAVTALLGQGNPLLARAAAALAGDAVGDDAVAGALLVAVAEALTYVGDGDGQDVWTCALGTYFRGEGDCEDGAILLHALLLAAGLPADRLVTAFGRVGIDKAGHAWVAYRRQGDGQWTVLDWTLGPTQGAVAGLPVLGESAYAAVVDYALTAGAFFPVRQAASVFFARALADAVVFPAPVVAAAACLGAWGRVSLPCGGVGVAGRGGLGGQGRLCCPKVLGVAGSFGGAAALRPLDSVASAGSGCCLSWPAMTVAGFGAGGGGAICQMSRWESSGTAVSAALAVSDVSLCRWRALGTGSCGDLGRIVCPWPRLRLRGVACAGGLASGRCGLPALALGGVAAVEERGTSLVPLGGLLAVGRARPGETAFATYGYAAEGGEEWA